MIHALCSPRHRPGALSARSRSAADALDSSHWPLAGGSGPSGLGVGDGQPAWGAGGLMHTPEANAAGGGLIARQTCLCSWHNGRRTCSSLLASHHGIETLVRLWSVCFIGPCLPLEERPMPAFMPPAIVAHVAHAVVIRRAWNTGIIVPRDTYAHPRRRRARKK